MILSRRSLALQWPDASTERRPFGRAAVHNRVNDSPHSCPDDCKPAIKSPRERKGNMRSLIIIHHFQPATGYVVSQDCKVWGHTQSCKTRALSRKEARLTGYLPKGVTHESPPSLPLVRTSQDSAERPRPRRDDAREQGIIKSAIWTAICHTRRSVDVHQIDSSAVAACTKKQRIPKWWQPSFGGIRLFSRERDQSTLHHILETLMAVSAHRTRFRFNGRP